MTSKDDADGWSKRQDLQETGIETRPYSSIHLHSITETPKHLLVKALVSRELQRRRGPNRWDTEVPVGDGRVDVLDYGPVDEPPAVYEIETNCSRQDRLEKAEQYSGDTLPPERVYFLDPTEAPDSIPQLTEWVRSEVVG